MKKVTFSSQVLQSSTLPGVFAYIWSWLNLFNFYFMLKDNFFICFSKKVVPIYLHYDYHWVHWGKRQESVGIQPEQQPALIKTYMIINNFLNKKFKKFVCLQFPNRVRNNRYTCCMRILLALHWLLFSYPEW